jgi:two-component sensor histidine kinase
MKLGGQLAGVEDARALAQAIVDTVREPLLVLDRDLRVVTASRSFYLTFRVNRQETQGQLLYSLGDGQWDIPALRTLLEKIVPEHAVLNDYEVEHEFPHIGRRVMLLNASKVFYDDDAHTTVLLAIEDITQRKAVEQEMEALLQQKELLLEEMQHRIANSLQIIASIIMLKARTVQSPETRLHLEDAHKRVMSVAAVQQHLQVSARGELIEVAPYLSKLCSTLAQSMIGEGTQVSIDVRAEGASVSSSDAVSIGLIVTEAVINALKHAFRSDEKDGRIVVSYEVTGEDWKLSVADNGMGKPQTGPDVAKVGLGTSIVNALAQQLDARVDLVTGQGGTTVSVSHIKTLVPMPRAA